MNGTYDLWEMSSGNLMGSFSSKGEALITLARALEQHGLSYADTVNMTHEHDDESEDVARGPALAKLALQYSRKATR